MREQVPESNHLLKEQPVTSYETLFRVSQAIGLLRDPDLLFKVVADELHQVVNFNYVLILQWADKTDGIQKDLIRVFDLPKVIEPPLVNSIEGISGWMYQNQQPILISDITQETRFSVAKNYLQNIGIQSLCAFPLTTAHRKIGMLLFGSKHSNAYTESEIRFLTMLASAVAVAIDDALHFDGMKRAQEEIKRSQEESRSEHERLKLLLDFTNAVASNLDFQELLQRNISQSSSRNEMRCNLDPSA